jgi:RNA polymerase sigma-70 factor (ECF subfamily)
MHSGFTNAELLATLPYLRRVAYYRTRNGDVAQDLVQATVVRMLHFKHQYQPGTRLKAWGVTILGSIWCQWVRNRQKWQKLILDVDLESATEGDATACFNSIDHIEARDYLHKFNEVNMSPAMRRAFNYICVEGLSYEEAAQKMQICAGTVKSRVFRAREAMLAKVEPV